MTKELTVTKEVTPLTLKVANIFIKDSKTMEIAVSLRSKMKETLKRISDERKGYTDPLKESIKKIEANYKPFEKILEDSIESLNTKMSRYQTEEMKRAQEEEAKIAARVGEGKGKLKVETALTKIDAIDTPEKKVGKTQFINRPELVITNLSLIPREYMIPDEVRIRKDLLAGIPIKGAEMQDRMIPTGY